MHPQNQAPGRQAAIQSELIDPVASTSAPPAAEAGRSIPVMVRPGAGLGKILAFFGLLVLLVFAFDRVVTSGLKRIRTSKFGSLNRVMAGRVNADIVINGSSRALTSYDPRVIQEQTGRSTYNLGLNGVQIDVQVAMLKAYLKHNTKPRLVIQNLEAFTFETTKKGELYDPALYIPYLNEDEFYQAFVRIDRGAWKWRHIPMYVYAVEDMKFTWAWGILGWLGFNSREDYFLGFNPRHLKWTEDFEHFKASVGEGVKFRIEPTGIAALVDLIETCQREHIELMFVYSPEYIEMQALELNRAEVFSKFRELSERHRVPIWDYSSSAIARVRENFYNSQHLNATGAAEFSADVARRLREHLQLRP